MILCKILLIIVLIALIMFSALLYLTAPNKRRDISLFYGRRYAHRGLHNDEVPENSLWAFRRAREADLGIELDVQMTLDKKLVVFHDGNLKRMCGQDGYLRDYTYEQLQNFYLKDTDEKIPLFEDVLKTLDGVNLICEIKSDNGAKNYELCEKTYDLLMTYNGNFCMESFSPFITGWFKKNHPEIIRGQLSCLDMDSGHGKMSDFLLKNLLLDFVSRPDFIAYDFKGINAFGYKFVKIFFNPFRICWTPRGEQEISKAAKEFDTIIFEDFSL